ncbi:MAG: ABC transporter permease [Planctomycetes bacterium]|nr:ABC transporter permease [Planctomycetota bacterium]
MISYIIRRLLQMGITLFVVSILSFLLVVLAPGDPFAGHLDPNALPADIERQRDTGGYDDPVVTKYLTFYGNFFSDLGAAFSPSAGYEWKLVSNITKEPVLPTMWRKMLVTLPLVILTTIIVWTLSFPIGIFSALRRGTFKDQTITVLSYTLIAFPGFWLALLVINFFTVQLGIPVISPETLGVELEGPRAFFDRTWHVAVPGIVGSFGGIAVMTRYVKGQMLEVQGQDYIRTAKAKGLDRDTVNYKHALRNASLPFITMLAGLLPSLFGGSVIFESIYSWPGLGRWFLEAVFTRDAFIVMANLFVGSGLTLMGILVSDLLYSVADPRIKLG